MLKQFVAWSCNGSSVAPLTDYVNNPIYQELIDEGNCWEVRSDERVHLDLRTSSGYTKEAEKLERNDSKINIHIQLKAAATKKLRFMVWAHSLGEYLYILTKNGLTLRHRTYAIKSERGRLARMREKQSVEKGVWYIGGRKRHRKRTKRGQRGRGLPVGLIASAAAPFLGEIAKPMFKKIFGGRR